VLFQKFHVLILKRFMAMMFFLIGDVGFHGFKLRFAYRECAVTFLLGERSQFDFKMNPFGRTDFDLFHHIRQTMRSTQSHQKMNVIFDAVDLFGHAAQISHDAPK
jgi:hypothetical protein